MKVAAVVLAAGASRRLGQPKQDVVLGTETLLERTIRIAKLAGLDPVFVVVTASRATSLVGDVQILVNENAGEGMAASIRIGIGAAAQANLAGVVILACDQPAVTERHLRELMRGGTEVVASAYASRKGVPAYLPSSAFEELLKLTGDTGARDLIGRARALDLPNGELDIDTMEDLTRARQLYCEDETL